MSNPTAKNSNGTYYRWSDTGRMCDAINQNCERCSIFISFGWHKNGVDGTKKPKCYQPEANEQLRERDKKLAEGKPVKLVRKHEKKWS